MLDQLKKNLSAVRERINAAAQRAGREPESVRLVGVTKYVDAATTALLVEAGCTILGENRPQSLWEKSSELNDPQIEWHLIGHLQRNKVKRTIEVATLIHSVDSLRLLNAIQMSGSELNKTVRVLLEVNVSGEASKHGFAPEGLFAAIEQAGSLSHLQVEGLMCMAGLDGNADDARREFDTLRVLSEQHQANCPANVQMNELSMGMSGDYEIAIESGATLVRVGSALFAEIE